jgi:hypothetical protein
MSILKLSILTKASLIDLRLCEWFEVQTTVANMLVLGGLSEQDIPLSVVVNVTTFSVHTPVHVTDTWFAVGDADCHLRWVEAFRRSDIGISHS